VLGGIAHDDLPFPFPCTFTKDEKAALLVLDLDDVGIVFLWAAAREISRDKIVDDEDIVGIDN